MTEIKKISLLIPVYNEERHLPKILERLCDVHFEGVTKELVMVDDASVDGSWEIMQAASSHPNVVIARHDVNKGKGSAIRTALSLSTGDVVVIQDADLEYVPTDLPFLLSKMIKTGSNVVYGNRNTGNNPRYSWLYYYGNQFLNLCVFLIYWKWVGDMETCYKMVKRDLMVSLKVEADRFDMEPEITSKLLRLKESIEEVPIQYKPRSRLEGKKITMRDGVQALWTLLKWRFKRF